MAMVSTLVQTHKTYVEWKIEQFKLFSLEDNHFLNSPSFEFHNIKWYLTISPNLPHEHFGLYLSKMECEGIHPVHFKIGYKLSDGSEFDILDTSHTFDEINYRSGREDIRRSSLLLIRGILLKNGSQKGMLTVFCKIRTLHGIEVTPQIASRKDSSTLNEDLKRLYLDRQHADITIKVKNKEVVAHKCILAARSHVFAAMFQHDMAENSSGTVVIDDSDPDSFEDFILYLYTGKSDLVSSRNAISLFKDASKYDIPELRKECVRTMIRELAMESFCDVVHLAIVYEVSDLHTAAMTFFSKNLRAILRTPKWKGFLAENPEFGNDLIIEALGNPENG